MKTNNRRVFPGMKQPCHKGKGRQDEAKERQEAYDKLSTQQKLDRLPPPPHATKQRARLTALLNKPSKVAKEPEVPTEASPAVEQLDNFRKHSKEENRRFQSNNGKKGKQQ